MNDPIRLSASSGLLTKRLLDAGRTERPREKAKTKTAAAAVLVATGSAWFFWRRSAWFLFGALGIVGAGVVASPRASRSELAADEAIVDVPVMAVRARVPDSFAADEDKPRITAPPAGVRHSVAAPAIAPPAESELDLVRRARVELRDDPQRSLATLDEHTKAFPRGELREEAAALRVEALLRGGDTSGSRAAAAAFVEAYPTSAYVERIRSLAPSRRK